MANEQTTAAPHEAEAGAAHALPPEPASRAITPAPEDFEHPEPARHLLWPVFWCGVAVGLYLLLDAAGWTPFHGSH